MAPTLREALLEQAARTSGSSNAQIQGFIEESESKIASLDSQIAALVELRERELRTLSALQYLIAPVGALPVELLVKIFVLTAREEVWKLSRLKRALRISHVCSHWRQITVNAIPRLWNGPIVVKIDRFTKISKEAYMDGLKTLLARSTPLPVPVSIEETRRDGAQEIPAAFEELLRISPRWRSVKLRGLLSPAFLRRLTEHGKDHLEEVVLGRDVDRLCDPATVLSFGSTPRLRKVTIDGSRLFHIPWTQLTDLTLSDRSPELCLNILTQCSNLVTASFRIAAWQGPPEPRTEFTLNHLRTLSLNLYTSGSFMPFLHHLCAPALESLRLTNVAQWTEVQFTAFQLRAPDITQLHIQYSTLSSADLRAALSYAPSLTHLSLTGCSDCTDGIFVRALHYKEGVTPLVPCLHTLVLNLRGIYLPEDVLASTIASRWWTDAELAVLSSPPAVARWTHVRLNNPRFLECVKDLRRQGLDVEE
ncbi:F-box domain-containing protein [Mycena venus]|uniref:F-box domain-containing protein n=1 Tax=Mycena venus TaxID=2733690 RepID=A0A8H6YV53_9AGAR|nr:F-box domain-containing protein [Mycena venus]